MPPTFPYMMAFILYGLVAVVVWLVSLFLALIPRSRPLSRKLSVAMLLSFPGVFVYQIVAFPILMAAFLIVTLPFRFVQPILNQDAIALMLALLIMVGGFATASVAGFADGWRVGWKFAGGARFSDVLKESFADRIIRSIIHRIRKGRGAEQSPGGDSQPARRGSRTPQE